jgi:hypothetical protein
MVQIASDSEYLVIGISRIICPAVFHKQGYFLTFQCDGEQNARPLVTKQ